MTSDFEMPREIAPREVPDLSGLEEAEFNELKKLYADVAQNPDEYEPWDALVKAAENLESGLNRNSSPQAISAFREIYDRFLAKFPLFFVYWKRYADKEFFIAGTEAAETVYERGVASIPNSVDLWTNYCAFKFETSHDADLIRELFERAAGYVGLDYQSSPFWDRYLEFEERTEAPDKFFAILDRVSQIPMSKYREYFEKFRQTAQYRPLTELADLETLNAYRLDQLRDNPNKTDIEVERDIRVYLDGKYLEVYTNTQAETLKRAPFEDLIKRPYFHVTELEAPELENWRKYLDFEEEFGTYERTKFLYERCIVVCALYEEFWLRYARWLHAQGGKTEEVRNVYQRASFIYVPIVKPTVRLHYAVFEESEGRFDIARDMHLAILMKLPAHLETIISLANLDRRHGGIDSAIKVYASFLQGQECDLFAKGVLVSEWANLLWKIKGSPEEAREVYNKNAQWYRDSRPFWVKWFFFELSQPTSAATEKTQYERIKEVWGSITQKAQIGPAVVKDLGKYYMEYLLERGTADSAKEYLKVDREINGSFQVRTNKVRLPEDVKGLGSLYLDGVPEANEGALRLGQSVYDRYYREPGEQTVTARLY
ncbi:mrna splicing protein [Venturia nashicola]|uniref:Mrna splicing protein n=1 Tax=Venturia nashicola TaxID=86259 RepID=A0A4Z1PFS0_9PEZI|nr:mrna splicing protein [Venturia nashicola]TLD39560.1 mrna splicing protein [Venturia nashicola]